MQVNMLRRRQISWVFEIVKLVLLGFSAYLTFGFLSRFLPNMWFRVLALILYEGGLIFWHFVHHYRSETPRQHLFSANMERLALAAVGCAAGYQLWSLVSAGFGDVLPNWTHFVIELATSAIFLLNVWAFMAWSKRSRYYEAVEQAYNRELATGQRALIAGALSAIGHVDVTEEREKAAPPESAPEAERQAISDTVSAQQTDVFERGATMVQNAANKLKPARLEDRRHVLELLTQETPDISVRDLARQSGLSPSTVRAWRREG